MKKFELYTLVLSLSGLISCGNHLVPDEKNTAKPTIFPDYCEVTVPSSIAPLNFRLEDGFSQTDAVFEGTGSMRIHVRNEKFIKIPVAKWTKMLESMAGESIRVTVSGKKEGKWIQFAPFWIHISQFPIDYGLVYRLIAPGYEVYSKMGIYQRNLSNYDQSAIFENTLITGSCVNCHSFRLSDPSYMNLHLRGPKGGTILVANGDVELLNTKTPKTISNFVYPFWHPSGNYLSYSVNNIKQVFHESKDKKIEVVDFESDIVVYDVKKNQTIFCDKLMAKTNFETFPSFSPDGRTLYFCSTNAKQMPAEMKEVRYNLCSISFNPDNGTFGDKIDTLFNANAIGKSVTFPRPSPDGKYLMFTLVDYGNFSIWHKEADLYLLNLKTGECKPIIEANSNDTESYHSWSSNSRWFVFSSRRIDGLYTRPFICQIDENGKIGKPFLLPQKNPNHHENLLYSYNIPEFISDKVELKMHEIEKLVNTSGTNVAQRE